jgi:hypothetical protein
LRKLNTSLNAITDFAPHGKWKRQDPGFPDAIFEGSIDPAPGFEIKAWFPLATEITARFRDSQHAFAKDNIHVAMLAWLPSHLIFGTPRILDVVVVSAASVAKARDDHYHDPPDYLVLEPEDTTSRTSNLRQTNTTGHKFQGTPAEFEQAKKMVAAWGQNGAEYLPTAEYQERVRRLVVSFRYRLDTNYAKMDRIVHPEIEAFKSRVLSTRVNGMSVAEWSALFSSSDNDRTTKLLEQHLAIKEVPADSIVE